MRASMTLLSARTATPRLAGVYAYDKPLVVFLQAIEGPDALATAVAGRRATTMDDLTCFLSLSAGKDHRYIRWYLVLEAKVRTVSPTFQFLTAL